MIKLITLQKIIVAETLLRVLFLAFRYHYISACVRQTLAPITERRIRKL
jgi:hypothetical protein